MRRRCNCCRRIPLHSEARCQQSWPRCVLYRYRHRDAVSIIAGIRTAGVALSDASPGNCDSASTEPQLIIDGEAVMSGRSSTPPVSSDRRVSSQPEVEECLIATPVSGAMGLRPMRASRRWLTGPKPPRLSHVTKFQHLLKIGAVHIRNTVAPLAIRTTPRSCLRPRAKSEKGVVVSVVPLDIQRRSERRWAARFAQPAQAVAPRIKPSQRIDVPAKGKRKTDRTEAKSRPLSVVWSRG